VKLRVSTVGLPLRSPFETATGTVTTRELLLVELEGSDGLIGRGEAAPLQHYDGVSIAAARDAIEDCRALLAASDGAERDDLLAACWEKAVLPQAVAALDLALWDLAGQRVGQPVWRLLGAAAAGPIPVNATIASADRAGAASEAAAAVAAGFTTVKVKVGLGDDGGRLAAIRAVAGPELRIRIDANGVWTVEEALANLRLLEPIGLELCEEPTSGLEPNAQVSATTPVPTAIDESSALPGATDHAVATALCLKISRCGGISGLLATAARARRAGYQVYLASTLDGPRGIAAALHAAVAVRPDRPCGLATLGVFAGAEVHPLARVDRGRLLPPSASGLAA
jgi:L-alanine-DL-glutamate epimerase-like enolase superfamily enzyme